MLEVKMIESLTDFCCQNKHDEPIHLVVLDPKLDKKQRLLCNKCMESFQSDAKTIGFKKVIQIIEEIIDKNMNNLENITQKTIQQLQICIKSLEGLKTQFINLFDSIISISENWTQNLLTQRQQYNQYSFYDELDSFIKNQNTNYVSNMTLINNINKSWMTKLSQTLNQFIQDQNKVNFEDIKEKFLNIIYSNLPQKGQIKLKLIGESVKQSVRCNDIVFDSSGSIMLSTEQNNIKVWKFLNGTITFINNLIGHTDWIQCLVYSKKQNSFISGSGDTTIRCWKQIDQTNWISSQPYQEHTRFVRCIILNSNEDILFSGSDDESIKVWNVDFKQNKLTYMYSLDKHDSYVMALSLNQSETQLVSCAYAKNQIIIWEREEQDKFEFKYVVIIIISHFIYKQSIQEYGLKIKFIKENQFIWITGGKEIDKLYIFELKEGMFQENQKKTIQLNKNNQISDEYHFPIVYNKEKNLIVLRHKAYIYFIKEIINGIFTIVHQFNCDTNQIFGTFTNKGQYLVYWDEKNQGYSVYELLNK